MWRLILMLWPIAAFAEVPQGAANADFKAAFAAQTRAEALPTSRIEVTTLANDLERPWGIAALPDGRFLVTERTGQLRLIDSDGTKSDPIKGIPKVWAEGQGGLLDVAVSPSFSQDNLIFFTYAKPVSGGAVTAAGRARLSRAGTLENVQEIFAQEPPRKSSRHFGSRIVPVDDGTVFITTGDRGAGDRGNLVQKLSNTHGKIVRLNWDGSIPSENPFVGRIGEDAIWSLGHRNVQGVAIGPGELWAIEHGPAGGDELNAPKAGNNYGWPLISYGVNYNGSDVGDGKATMAGMVGPRYYWDPVIAPSGMIFYGGNHRAWRGDIFIGSLNPGALVRLKLDQGRVIGEEQLLNGIGRVRDVVEGIDGALYILIDSARGSIIRIQPKR